MTTSQSTFQFALQTMWPQSEINDLVYKDNPALALIKKREDFYGENMYFVQQYAPNTGRSHTFAKSQANRTSVKGVRFLATHKKDYATAEIDTLTIRASKRNPGALQKAMETEVASALNELSRSMGIDGYRSGSGARGNIGASASSPITLADPADITNFEIGMKLVASQTDGGALRDSGAVITITGIDRDAGSFAYTGTISGLDAGDFLYVEGDAKNNSTQLAMTGWGGWLPYTAPGGGDSFMGVNRSVDTTRLAGVRMDISSALVSEGSVRFLNRLAREGGSPDYFFCDFEQFSNFELELGAKVQYIDVEVGNIGFRGVRITAGKRSVNVMPDRNCPYGRGYGIQMNTWEFHSAGAAPGFLDDDGVGKSLRVGNADSVEIRLGYYGELGCTAVGWNGVCKLPGASS